MCYGGGGGSPPTIQQRTDEQLQRIAAGPDTSGWVQRTNADGRSLGPMMMGPPIPQPQQNLNAAGRPMGAMFGSSKTASLPQQQQNLSADGRPMGAMFASQKPAPKPPSMKEQAQAEINRRTALRNQIADQEKAMKATQAQIQQNLVTAQAKQIEQEAAQRKQVADLQAQQVQRTGEIAATGQAVSSSLRILANAGSKQGPTAAMAPRVKGKASAAPVRSAGLRMGSTMTGSGVGTNLGT